MKNKKALSLILALTLTLTAAVAALAESTDTTTSTASTTPATTDGTAAAATSDADYQAALDKYNAAKQATELSDLKTELDAMVQAGTLTQEEADAVYNQELTASAIRKYCEAKRESAASDPLASYKEELDAMVAAGQLTQDEADLLYQNASQTGNSSPYGNREQRGQDGFGFNGKSMPNMDGASSATPNSGSSDAAPGMNGGMPDMGRRH